MARNIAGITEDGIKYNLKILQKNNVVKHVGSTKKGQWIVTGAEEGKKETRFKQTETGAIPEDWEVKPLGDILDFCTSTRDSKLTNSKYYVTTESMLPNGTI
jgi:hypothetical protein